MKSSLCTKNYNTDGTFGYRCLDGGAKIGHKCELKFNNNMKNYVVGILSMFENDLKLFKVKAENEYEAVKKGMIEFAPSDEQKKDELEWQNSDDYPKDLKGMVHTYEDFPFSVIEVTSH